MDTQAVQTQLDIISAAVAAIKSQLAVAPPVQPPVQPPVTPPVSDWKFPDGTFGTKPQIAPKITNRVTIPAQDLPKWSEKDGTEITIQGDTVGTFDVAMGLGNDVVIKWDGKGARPVLCWNKGDGFFFWHKKNVVIDGLVLKGVGNDQVMHYGICGKASFTVLRNLSISGFLQGLNMEVDWNDLLVENCSIDASWYPIWWGNSTKSKNLWVCNTTCKSPLHACRGSGSYVFVENSTFVAYGENSRCSFACNGDHIYCRGNSFSGTSATDGRDNTVSFLNSTQVVIENCTTNNHAGISFTTAAKTVRIRQNKLASPVKLNAPLSQSLVDLTPVTDIRVMNNTFSCNPAIVMDGRVVPTPGGVVSDVDPTMVSGPAGSVVKP